MLIDSANDYFFKYGKLSWSLDYFVTRKLYQPSSLRSLSYHFSLELVSLDNLQINLVGMFRCYHTFVTFVCHFKKTGIDCRPWNGKYFWTDVTVHANLVVISDILGPDDGNDSCCTYKCFSL